MLKRVIYARFVAIHGVSHEVTITSGNNLASSLVMLDLWDEATPFLRDLLPEARRSLGPDHSVTLRIRRSLADTLHFRPGSTRNDLRWNQRP